MKQLSSRFRKSIGPVIAIVAALATLAVFAACGDDVTVPRQDSAISVPAQGAGNVQGSARLDFASVSKERRPETTAAAPGTVSMPPDANQVVNASSAALVAPTMVIRNGAASIEVDSLEIAINALQQLATSMGGYVGNTSLSSGAYSVRSAQLELKIPSSRYDAAVGSLAPIGKIESQTSTAEDVGEEFVDVTARQANAHRLEDRLIALLATRTGKLEDVLAVERELARVREEIERYEGRLRYLKSHIATSTLSVTVHEKQPVVREYAGRNVIAESFKNAWKIFVQFVAFSIASLGWIIPVGLIVAVASIFIKRYRRNHPASPGINRKHDSDTPKP